MKKVVLFIFTLFGLLFVLSGEIQEFNSIFIDLTDSEPFAEESMSLKFVNDLLKEYPNIRLMEKNTLNSLLGIDPEDKISFLSVYSWEDSDLKWKERCSDWSARALILHKFIDTDEGKSSSIVWIDSKTGIISRDILSLKDASEQEFFFLALGYGTDFEPDDNKRFELTLDLDFELLDGLLDAGPESVSDSVIDEDKKDFDIDSAYEEENDDKETEGDEAGVEDESPESRRFLFWPLRKQSDGSEYNCFFLDFTDRGKLDDPDIDQVEQLKEMLSEKDDMLLASEEEIKSVLRDSGYSQPREGVGLADFDFYGPSYFWYSQMENWGVRYLILYNYAEVFGRSFVDLRFLDAMEKTSSTRRTGLSGGYDQQDVMKSVGPEKKGVDEFSAAPVGDEQEPEPEPFTESPETGDREFSRPDADLDKPGIEIEIPEGAGSGNIDSFLFDFTENKNRKDNHESIINSIAALLIREGKFCLQTPVEAPDPGRLSFESSAEDWEKKAEKWSVRYIILLRLTSVYQREFFEWTLIDRYAESFMSGRIGAGDSFEEDQLISQILQAGKELDLLAEERPDKITSDDGGLGFSLVLYGDAGYALEGLAELQTLSVGGGGGLILENLFLRNLSLSLMGGYGMGLMGPDSVDSISYIAGNIEAGWSLGLGQALKITPSLGGGIASVTGALTGNLSSQGESAGLIGTINAGLLFQIGKGIIKVFVMPRAVYFLDSNTMLDAGVLAGVSLF